MRTTWLRSMMVLAAMVALGATGCDDDDDGPDGDEDAGLPPGDGGPVVRSWDADPAAIVGEVHRWTFDTDAAGALPPGFESPLGEWQVALEPTAPSAAQVLRQLGTSSSAFPRAVVSELRFTDVHLMVRCRPETGAIDQACGAIVRAVGPDDYYIARANALEDNVRFYHVVGGVRQQLVTTTYDVTAGEWHTLEIEARGTHFIVRWDGAELLATDDTTFGAGRVGLWTKADSVTAFDDLVVEAL